MPTLTTHNSLLTTLFSLLSLHLIFTSPHIIAHISRFHSSYLPFSFLLYPPYPRTHPTNHSFQVADAVVSVCDERGLSGLLERACTTCALDCAHILQVLHATNANSSTPTHPLSLNTLSYTPSLNILSKCPPSTHPHHPSPPPHLSTPSTPPHHPLNNHPPPPPPPRHTHILRRWCAGPPTMSTPVRGKST